MLHVLTLFPLPRPPNVLLIREDLSEHGVNVALTQCKPDPSCAAYRHRNGKRGGVIKKWMNRSSYCPVFMLSQDPSHVSSQELAMFSVMDCVSHVVEAHGESFRIQFVLPHEPPVQPSLS